MKLFIIFLSLRFFNMRRERDNFFLCWLFHLNPTMCGSPAVNYRSGLGKLRKSICPGRNSINCFFFFTSPKSSALPGMMSFTSPVSFPIWVFYCDIWLSHPPRVCEHQHSTNPCTKRKVLRLTKPKGKIYKMKNDDIKKSLCNYITLCLCDICAANLLIPKHCKIWITLKLKHY